VQEIEGTPLIRESPELNSKFSAAGFLILGVAGSQNKKADTRRSWSDHSDFARGRSRQIDDASFDKRTPIIDADFDAPVVVEVRDHDASSEVERTMGGGEVVHIVDLTAGGAATVVRMAIPARNAGFDGIRRRRT
jgi:hypothetical protein